MKFHVIALAALCLVPLSARADKIAHQGDDWVQITDKPCTLTLPQVDPSTLGDWHAAHAKFQGQDFKACWYKVPDGVALAYEDGDVGIVPDDELKPVMDL